MSKQENQEKLKIPKGQSEVVNWRRTDNTMTKIKKTKEPIECTQTNKQTNKHTHTNSNRNIGIKW